MCHSERGRFFICSAVIAFALFLAGIAVSAEKESKTAGTPELPKAVVWTGDMEALVLLRENGVRAATGSCGTDAEDPYVWLYAGKKEGAGEKAGETDENGQINTGEKGAEVPAEQKENGKVIYLTFDDGPSRNTEKILDILETYHAKATFFLIGENLTETGLEIAKRAASEGHLLGMHTDSHRYERIYASPEAFLKDYNRLAEKFMEGFGECPACFRFPGGSCSSYINPIRDELKEELRKRGFLCYDWNVSGEDSVGTPTAASIKKNIFGKIYSVREPIVLLHDSPCNGLTAEVLPQILERLTEEGYEFRTLKDRKPYQFPW